MAYRSRENPYPKNFDDPERGIPNGTQSISSVFHPDERQPKRQRRERRDRSGRRDRRERSGSRDRYQDNGTTNHRPYRTKHQSGYPSRRHAARGEPTKAKQKCLRSWVVVLALSLTAVAVVAAVGLYLGVSKEAEAKDLSEELCETPPSPLHGHVTTSGRGSGATAQYSCTSGYTLLGPQKRTCSPRGTWSGHQPTCDKVYDGGSGQHHPCDRACVAGDRRACRYIFKVEWYHTLSSACHQCPFVASDCSRPDCIAADGQPRSLLSINRQLPAPTIAVCEGDRVIVELENDLINGESTTIHWHGLKQFKRNWMDGVGKITQCAIPSANKFTYDFVADPVGTHWYHSHQGLQRTDGMFGPFIVREAADPHASLYDYDLTDHVVLLNDWTPQPFVSRFLDIFAYRHFNPFASISGLVNGKARQYPVKDVNGTNHFTERHVFSVTPGQRFRFRIINAAESRAFKVNVDGHKLKVIAADGTSIEPVDVDYFTINEGETFDFILTASEAPDNYWVRARSVTPGDPLATAAVLRYTGALVADPTADLSVNADTGKFLNPSLTLAPADRERSHGGSDDIDIDDVRSVSSEGVAAIMGEPDEKLYLGFDFLPNDYSRFHDPRYPPTSVNHVTTTINNITMCESPVPLIELGERLPKEWLCNGNDVDHDKCSGTLCSCLHVHKIGLGELVEMIMFSTGLFSFDAGHPMHMHGDHFYVLGREQLNQTSLLLHQVQALDQANLLQRNFDRPVLKQTVHVPNVGYAVLRFRATNPGYWLLHCHIAHHNEYGMAMVLQVGEPRDMPRPPPDTPTCGAWAGF